MSNLLEDYIDNHFGADPELFLRAIKSSPSSRGYIMGAISEVILKNYLENKGFEVLRIKEKPSGGNNAKSSEARGDFYIRPKGSDRDAWFVVESKGLKSNSEFRGAKLDNKAKLFRFLKSVAFSNKKDTYDYGYSTYLRVKKTWEKLNKSKKFPDFKWDKKTPGPVSSGIRDLWKDEKDLKEWIEAQPVESFEEKSYRNLTGPIAVLETHQPSTRIDPATGIKQAAPLVSDFNIMAVDLFLRTKEHKFVFMNPEAISHSPTSPNHIYQNYIIDILVKGKKETAMIKSPWYHDILDCVSRTKPHVRKLDKSQLDSR